MSEYTITYTYDNLNRVIRKERSDGAVVEFEYDTKGRLKSKRVRTPAQTAKPPVPVIVSNHPLVVRDSSGTTPADARGIVVMPDYTTTATWRCRVWRATQ